MKNFEYISASDLAAAIAILREPQTEALAGGTDLLGQLKNRIRAPKRLVNLKPLQELRQIRYGEELTMGALVNLTEVERHPVVSEKFPILARAALLVGTPQLRNMGTVGGNLCQRPRCWYYRSPLFPCWLKGGEKCFAVQGENKYHAILGRGMCQAVHPSDLAPALISLEARVKTAGLKEQRSIPLEELYKKPVSNHRQVTILEPGELITELCIPAQADGSKGIYLKAMDRQAWSFALVSLAAQVRMDGPYVAACRFVLGGVAPIPWRAKEAEEVLKGQKISAELMGRAGEAAVSSARPLRDNEYKVGMVKGLYQKASVLLFNLK